MEIPGIETTTGPLGQGLGNALGMAVSEKIVRSRVGEENFNHYTYVIAGDGCLMEGISHEVASLAGHLSLSNLIVLYDDNEISIDGPTSLTMSDKTLDRFLSYGWHTEQVDGHDLDAINLAIDKAIYQSSNDYISKMINTIHPITEDKFCFRGPNFIPKTIMKTLTKRNNSNSH